MIALLLPLSGWATLRVLDRLRLVRRGFGVLFRRLAFRREVRALRRERDQLVATVISTVSAVKPATLDALFPPGSSRSIEESSRARRDADLDAELDKREERVKPLVVLLHGLARGRGSMERLGAQLRAQDFETWSHTYPSRKHSITYLASALTDAARRASPATARSTRSLTRWAASIVRHLHDPRLRWERIVMLAPPNQGSRLAAGLVRQSAVPLVLRPRRRASWPTPRAGPHRPRRSR